MPVPLAPLPNHPPRCNLCAHELERHRCGEACLPGDPRCPICADPTGVSRAVYRALRDELFAINGDHAALLAREVIRLSTELEARG